MRLPSSPNRLVRALAVDLAPAVTANCIVPRLIMDAKDGPDAIKRRQQHVNMDLPAGRAGTVADIAETVAMFCSPKMKYVTGEAVHVNGGAYYSS